MVTDRKWLAGDTLWFVYERRSREPETVTIKKVGRDWLTLSNGRRARKDTLVLDGLSGCRDAVYPSREHYMDLRERQVLWDVIRHRIRSAWMPPAALSTEQLVKIADQLNPSPPITPEKKEA